jgi:acetylornithine deacetylase/succinyl-diaminopimelate desuccinylase-like protein
MIIEYSKNQIINELIVDLQTLNRQPSISSNGYGILECAKLVSDLMRKAGIKSHLFFLQNKRIPPIVFGEVKSKDNPNAKTLLFYNHYDTQPIGSINLWTYHPFSGTVVGNKIFGRGSSDDKGELITRIKAIKQQLESTGDVPCNVKFIVEGEEEIGSPHLKEYFAHYGYEFKCDAVV